MKNLIKTLSAVMLVTATNACTLQEAPDSTNPGAITITAQTVQEQAATSVPATKTILSGTGVKEGLETHWEANEDQIGLFSPQGKATSDGTPAANPAKNLAFTAQASAKNSSFNGTMFWGSDSNHNFYAYYPYDSEYSGNQTVVPISLPSAQSQSAAGNTDHIGALDYMVATPLTVSYEGTVSLTFNHVFAMIEFQIKGSGNLTGVSFNGSGPLACEGTIDLTQTPGANAYTITTSSTSKYVTITLGSAAALSSETAVSVYMMVLPGMQSENLLIELEVGGIWKEMTKAPPTGGFVRGKKYVVTLNTTTDPGWSTNVFTDSRDGNTYSYKTFGTQAWMIENLAYLPSVNNLATGSEDTHYETVPFYYVYGYDGTDVDEDGDV
ncbi:MAG: fimbrillin family protein, partial [Bacteroidales bacterium]